MLHLVCDCGALLTLAPAAAGRTVSCRACGATRLVPDPAALGLAEAVGEPARAPSAAPAPPVPAADPRTPLFGHDDRLDLPVLERHAARMGALAALAWVAGLLGAGGVYLVSSRPAPEKALLAMASIFAALLAWAGFRAARAAALAAVALAQRQREIVQGMGR